VLLLGALPSASLAANELGAVSKDGSGAWQFISDPQLYRANELAQAHGGLGAYRDAGTSNIVMRMPKAAAATLTSADTSSVGAPVDVQESRFDSTSIAAMESEVEALHTRLTHDQVIASGYDIVRDLFVVESNAPGSTFADLENRNPGQIEYIYANISRDSRHDDRQPHWGGAELWLNGQQQCTSGYSIGVGSSHYMVTAGHCYSPGTTVLGGTGISWGTILYRNNYPTTDVELIGGSSYSGQIYTSSTASMAVKGYIQSLVGSYPYCVSGAVTGTNCAYTETAENQSYTDSVGTTTGLVILQGNGGAFFGDSGAPAYGVSSGYAFIFGSVVAGEYLCGSCRVWIEPYHTRVQSLYNAGLVTG
jgi:hypothetical protein